MCGQVTNTLEVLLADYDHNGYKATPGGDLLYNLPYGDVQYK